MIPTETIPEVSSEDRGRLLVRLEGIGSGSQEEQDKYSPFGRS